MNASRPARSHRASPLADILACGITTATLTTIIFAVGSRYMLTYVLGSLESKLCLLCELNPVGVVSRLFITVVLLLLVLLALGGMLAVGQGWGFAAAAVCPFMLFTVRPLFLQFRNGAMQLHLEARSCLGLGQAGVDFSRIRGNAGGGRGRASAWMALSTSCASLPVPASERLPASNGRASAAALASTAEVGAGALAHHPSGAEDLEAVGRRPLPAVPPTPDHYHHDHGGGE